LVEVQSTNSGASDTGFTLVTPDRTWNFGQNIGGIGVGNFNIYDVTASASRMLIDTNGNIGIGTMSPGAKLDVSGVIIGGGGDANIDPNHSLSGQILNYLSGSAKFAIGWNRSAGGGETDFISNRGAGNIGGFNFYDYYGTTLTNIMTINGNGNVGIGTTSPNAKLQVVGGAIMPEVGNSASAGIYFPTNPGGGGEDEAFIRYYVESGETTKLLIGINNDPDDRLSLYQYGAERLTIYNGNVGIGTTSPSSALHVIGTFTATGTKNFEIDHPTKPGMKLVHSAIEGPEAAVYYRGKGVLTNGEVIIELPEYFEALTRKEDRTIQLTAKGIKPYLLSASEIENGKFTVYGTESDGEFYWEVKAVRADVDPLQVEKIKEEK